MADYNKQIAELNSQPVIAQKGNLKLVGVPGTTGSTAYYQALNVIGLTPGDLVMQNIGWHSNSELIGGNGKAVIYSGQMSLAGSDSLSNFYNITGTARSNGTITLTNAATDQYGRSFDLHLVFNNSGTPDTGNSNDPTNLIIGPSGADGSIELDAYGGFHFSNVNIPDVYFTQHGSSDAANVTVISTFGDLDSNQFIKTSLGDGLSWVPSKSGVTDNGGGYFSAPANSFDGYDSTPQGTLLLVGQGKHFNFTFGWDVNDNPKSMYHFIHNTKDPFAYYGQKNQETGYQFNLFGPSATTKVVIPPVRETTQAHYHYDTKSVKILMPEVLIYGHFRHYLHVL